MAMLSASARKFGLMFRGLRQISLARIRSALHRKRWSAGPFPELILAGPLAEEISAAGQKPEEQLRMSATCFQGRCPKDAGAEGSFVTRVGDIYCGVGCYNSRGTRIDLISAHIAVASNVLDYSDCAENASQAESSPELNPFMNHRLRCAEVPCVNASGTT